MSVGRLGNFVSFRSGKSSPTRVESGAFRVYGSNGPIGWTNEANTSGPSVVVGRVGSYCGSVHFSSVPVWVTDNALSCSPLTPGEERFWFYALQQLDLNTRSSGSGQPLLNQATLTSIPYSPPHHQGRLEIAEVLGALDDLIDTNERLSASSVALARVEFRRRFPSFADSPTNPVPFTQLVDVLSGGTPRTSEDRYWDGEIPWFSIADAPGENQPWVIDTSKHVSELGLQNSPASLLDVGTVILTARGTVGKVAMIGAPMAINQSCYGLRSRSGTSGCFEFLATESLVDRLRTASHGSVFDTITRQTLERTYVQDIPQSERNGFDSAVRPLLDACRDLAFENAQLRRTRDELLPLLMSGKVRVRPKEVSA
jgi:type I restriction enzyme S subunit